MYSKKGLNAGELIDIGTIKSVEYPPAIIPNTPENTAKAKYSQKQTAIPY